MSINQILTTTNLPFLEIRVLLSLIINRDSSYVVTHPEYILNENEQKRWDEWSKRAQDGEPIPYITNHKEFYGYNFYVDNRVLIPRPETEELVDRTLQWIKDHLDREKISILEVGTGSGSVIVSLALKLEELNPTLQNSYLHSSLEFIFTATDISSETLTVARHNAKRHNVSNAITFLQGDLFAPIHGMTFDIILANLPYIPTDESQTNIFEPQIALDGGNNGTKLNERLLTEYKKHLHPTGTLIFETYAGKVIQTPGV